MSAPKHRKAQPRHILAARVAELRAEGLNGAQIARRLDISKTYCHALVHDPTGKADRQRKLLTQYGFCVDCGARTSYASGGPAERCEPCANDARAIWTQDAIVCAIQEWSDEYGGIPPTANDWFRARAAGDYNVPSVAHVLRRFGAWNAAIRAAGYEPHPTGPVGGYTRLTPAQRAECASRYAAGEPSTRIAADLGCSPVVVIKWVRRAGVEIRPPFGRVAA